LFNVSERTVRDAVAVRAHAIPAIVTACEQGEMPVSQAALVARLPEARQQRIAAELGNGRSVSTIVQSASRSERVSEIERRSVAGPLSALGRLFPVLYADPPWSFSSWSDGGILKNPQLQYPTMSSTEIAALPVGEIAARDAVLFMWVVPAMFYEARDVVTAWGFTYKTFAVWVKPHIACGYWFRGQFEPLIVATRGNMPPPPASQLHSSVFHGEAASRYSAKPDCVRDWIASAYPAAGKIELFARTAAPGWMAWGHEAPADPPPPAPRRRVAP
jgi:N6-adenosine-specific RNA methylase IME4